ncbi:MAG: hypothetical protein ACRC80_26650 [Waterburya sp.]
MQVVTRSNGKQKLVNSTVADNLPNRLVETNALGLIDRTLLPRRIQYLATSSGAVSNNNATEVFVQGNQLTTSVPFYVPYASRVKELIVVSSNTLPTEILTINLNSSTTLTSTYSLASRNSYFLAQNWFLPANSTFSVTGSKTSNGTLGQVLVYITLEENV